MDEDEVVERMRSADPAAGAEPDAERLAELTAERRADELAARRGRRSPRWAAVAAVAAGALVVGGAGFGLGRASDDRGPQADVAADRAASLAQEGLAGTETMSSWGGASMPGFGGERMNFTADGLSDDAGTAAAWAFDGAGTVTAEAAARAAEVFGVAGEPREEGGWIVGTSDGTEPTVHVMPDGTATVRFHDPELYRLIEDVAPHPMPAPDSGAAEPAVSEPHLLSGEGSSGSAAGGSAAADSPVASGDDDGEPAQDQPAPPPDEPTVADPEPQPTAVGPVPADEPTDDGSADDAPAPEPTSVQPLPAPVGPVEEPTAVAPDGQAPDGPAGVLYETLAALGLDPDAAEYATQDHWAGDEMTNVVAHQLVDGTRTGQTWHADVVDGELYSFTGPLAPLVPLGEYDVVSPAQAVDRLGDPRFGGSPVWSGEITVMPMVPESSTQNWDDPPGPPPEAGAPIPWAVTDVTIVSAEPALVQQQTSQGAALLLPAYELSDSEGRAWSVLAVADHELAS